MRYSLVLCKEDGERSMVRLNYEMSAIDVLAELLDSKDNGQCFFLQLSHDVGEDCTNPILGGIAS